MFFQVFYPEVSRLSAGRLIAGLRVGSPVGVFLPWGMIAVAAPWPLDNQPPRATWVLTMANLLMENPMRLKVLKKLVQLEGPDANFDSVPLRFHLEHMT